MQFIKWAIYSSTYEETTFVRPDRFCNGFTAINRGDGVVYLNGIPLAPSTLGAGNNGESVSVGGNIGEIYDGVIEVSFVPGALVNALVLIQKYYLDNPK